MLLFLGPFINHQLPPLLQDFGRLLTSQDLSYGSICYSHSCVNLGRIDIVLWSFFHRHRTATFFGCLFPSFSLFCSVFHVLITSVDSSCARWAEQSGTTSPAAEVVLLDL